MTFREITLLFEKYKERANAQIGIDLSKIELKLGKNEDFPNGRDYAYTLVKRVPEVVIAPKIKNLSLSHIKGILLHELAHVILIVKKQRNHTERKADKTAKKIFGKHIYYGKNLVQNTKRSYYSVRPKRLNPKPSQEELNKVSGAYADDLYWAMLRGNPEDLSHLVAFLNMGYWCIECSDHGTAYSECKCEGSRKHKFDNRGNIIQGPCEQCKQNYCICNYNQWKKNIISPENVRKLAYLQMTKTLTSLDTKISILLRLKKSINSIKNENSDSLEDWEKELRKNVIKSSFLNKFDKIFSFGTYFDSRSFPEMIERLNKELL